MKENSRVAEDSMELLLKRSLYGVGEAANLSTGVSPFISEYLQKELGR